MSLCILFRRSQGCTVCKHMALPILTDGTHKSLYYSLVLH